MAQRSDDGNRLVIVLPALNEEATVGRVVTALLTHRAMQALPVARIVVVDNGSTDATSRVAAEAGAQVACEPRRGYGAACRAGLLAARDLCESGVVLLMDADGSDDLDGAARVAAAVLSGAADLAVGSRTRGRCQRGALTVQQRVGNAVAALTLRAVYRLRVSDIGPTRAIRIQTLLDLDMHEMSYGWSTEMLAKAVRAGLRVCEIPVDYYRRAGGRSKVGGTLSGSVKAALHIVRTLMRYARWAPPVAATESGGERRALVIVARVPVTGQTKTRLGRVIGHAAATGLYRAFLADLGVRFTAAAARDGYDLVWLYAACDGMAEAEFARCVPSGGILVAQRGNTFAERLWHGVQAVAACGYTRVVVVSSDSPHLPSGRVQQAFDALATHDVALGPAADGGYYLIGQRANPTPTDLFSGIEMSTSLVCAQTRARVASLGLSLSLLPTTFDVDEAADLAPLRTALQLAPSDEADPCPATLAALRAVASSTPATAGGDLRVGIEAQ